ncbi:hypothetical protein C8039_02145 [Halogeometricum sp. wsp3]|nr:hypothetical protein C8039_02145 [Halogeometricum sp. wsp3]
MTAVSRHTDPPSTSDLVRFRTVCWRGLGRSVPDAPDSALGIDPATYRRATDIHSEYDLIQARHNTQEHVAKVIARRVDVPVVSREGNTRDGFVQTGGYPDRVTNPLASRVVCISDSSISQGVLEASHTGRTKSSTRQSTTPSLNRSTEKQKRPEDTAHQTTLSSSATRPCSMNKRHRTR